FLVHQVDVQREQRLLGLVDDPFESVTTLANLVADLLSAPVDRVRARVDAVEARELFGDTLFDVRERLDVAGGCALALALGQRQRNNDCALQTTAGQRILWVPGDEDSTAIADEGRKRWPSAAL